MLYRKDQVHTVSSYNLYHYDDTYAYFILHYNYFMLVLIILFYIGYMYFVLHACIYYIVIFVIMKWNQIIFHAKIYINTKFLLTKCNGWSDVILYFAYFTIYIGRTFNYGYSTLFSYYKILLSSKTKEKGKSLCHKRWLLNEKSS